MTSIPAPLHTDRLFHDSPDAGEPSCLCSRCGHTIAATLLPIRMFVDGGRGGEYRYHGNCLGFEDFANEDIVDPEDAP